MSHLPLAATVQFVQQDPDSGEYVFRGTARFPDLLFPVQLEILTPTPALDTKFEEAFQQFAQQPLAHAEVVFLASETYFMCNEDYFGPEEDYEEKFADFAERQRFLERMQDVTIEIKQGQDTLMYSIWHWWDWPWDGEHGVHVVLRGLEVVEAGDGEIQIP